MRLHSLTLGRRAIAFSVLSTLVLIGPPRIAIREVAPGTAGAPAGAVFMMKATHHDANEQLAVRGRAEGMQGGKRVSHPLALTRTTDGQYAVTRQWQAGTPWVLVFTVEQGNHGAHGVAEALAKADASGRVVGLEHPAAGWVPGSNLPRRVGEKEIAALLASITARRSTQ